MTMRSYLNALRPLDCFVVVLLATMTSKIVPYRGKKSYCQIWCMGKISSGDVPIGLFNNLHTVFKRNVINDQC